MESNDRQVEKLKNKIEKYRQAVEDLNSNRTIGSTPIETRIARLEEQYAELQHQHAQLSRQMNELESIVERQGQDEKQENQLQQSSRKTIPSFNELKQMANETSVLYASSPAFSQGNHTHAETVNKQRRDHNHLPMEESRIGHPVIEHNPFQLEETTEPENNGAMEESSGNTHLDPPEPAEDPEEKSNTRPSSFWRGIRKK